MAQLKETTVDGALVVNGTTSTGGVHLGASGATPYVYTEKNNINFRYANEAGTTTSYASIAGIVGDIKNCFSSTASRTANTVLAAPNGSAGGATFRKLVAGDLGAIAESNLSSLTTATGSWYIKFADGTLICFNKVAASNKSVNSAWGSCYESAAISLGNWKVSFLEKPVVSAEWSGDGTHCWLEGVSAVSTTSAGTTYLVRPNTATISGRVCIIGIGRWK